MNGGRVGWLVVVLVVLCGMDINNTNIVNNTTTTQHKTYVFSCTLLTRTQTSMLTLKLPQYNQQATTITTNINMPTNADPNQKSGLILLNPISNEMHTQKSKSKK